MIAAARTGATGSRSESLLLAGAILVVVAATAAGSRLIATASRVPATVASALRVEAQANALLGVVAGLESDRRAYELTAMPEHLAALASDHARVHDGLRTVREEVPASPVWRTHLDSAEAAVGTWTVERGRAPVSSAAAATGVGRDRALLDAARRHVSWVADAARHQADSTMTAVSAAGVRSRRLWVLATGIAVTAILALAGVARRRQRRAVAAADEVDTVLRAQPMAMLSLDEHGVVRHASGLVQQLLAVPAATLVGRRLTEVIASHDRRAVESALAQAQSGARVACEAQIRTASELTRVLALAFSPEHDHRLAGTVAVVARDATAERAFKTDALHLDRLARIGRLAGGVAHELSSPLTSIIGLTASVDWDGLDGERRRALQRIGSEARRAVGMVRTIKDFSRRQSHQHDPTDLVAVVQQALSLRCYDPRTRDISYALEPAPDLPPIQGDWHELLQVFINLLTNAEQAVRGQRTRQIVVAARLRDGMVQVSVDDSGPGIPADRLEIVFQPFYTTKPPGEGTGIGLALARGVVAEHGGTIRAEPSALGGARFVVALPALTGLEPAALAASRAALT